MPLTKIPLTLVVLLVLSATGCRTVVTTTTEVRPSRYAVLEFVRPIPQDTIVEYLTRAVAAESVHVERVDTRTGTVRAGPVAFHASDTEPALQANLTISTAPQGAETRIQIVVSALLPEGRTGGQDARLLALAQRIERRVDELIGH